jgi:hypothetical protein
MLQNHYFQLNGAKQGLAVKGWNNLVKVLVIDSRVA